MKKQINKLALNQETLRNLTRQEQQELPGMGTHTCSMHPGCGGTHTCPGNLA